jgi:hypothetical protein
MNHFFIKIFVFCTVLNVNLCFSQEQEVVNKETNYNNFSNAKNYGKSVAVFGGSVSSISASNAAKDIWASLLNFDITTYGHGGAGLSIKSYASKKENNSIPLQVRDSKIHDIYVIWNSTNDMGTQIVRKDRNIMIPVKIGTPDDDIITNISESPSTEMTPDWLDAHLDSTELTVCAGLNYCIKTIYKKNPLAEIYLFTPIRSFDKEVGHTSKSGVYLKNNLMKYRDANVAVFKKHGLPFLDLYYESGFTKYNFEKYFSPDSLHMTELGYLKVSKLQVDFLKNGR